MLHFERVTCFITYCVHGMKRCAGCGSDHPRYLACGHAFCTECLKARLQTAEFPGGAEMVDKLPSHPPAANSSSSTPQFRYTDQQQISPSMKYSIRRDPMIDPKKTPCKHGFCKTCIDEHLARQQMCPVCHGELRVTELAMSETMDEFLLELQVYCLNHHCSWKGPCFSLAEHLARTCESWECSHVSALQLSWQNGRRQRSHAEVLSHHDCCKRPQALDLRHQWNS